MESIKDTVKLQRPPRAEDQFMALVMRIDADTKITRAGLARFLTAALDDPAKAALLRSYDGIDAMLVRAEMSPNDIPGLA